MRVRHVPAGRIALGAGLLVSLAACGRELGTAPRASLLEIAPSTVDIDVAEKARLFPSLKDAHGNLIAGDHAFVWRSRDPAVASVSASGEVTGVSLGTAPVEVTASGLTGSAVVTVRIAPPARVTLEPALASFARGDSLRLQARALSVTGATYSDRRFTFTSSDASVVTLTVDPQEASVRLTAVAPGRATISAANLGVSGTADVTVLADPVIGLAVSVVAFQAVAGGVDPPSQAVRVQNAGGGTLRGLSVGGISYGPSQPSGWLRATFPTTPATGPVDLQVTAAVAGLPTGVYSASVAVRSSQQAVAEGRVSVSFGVNPPPVLTLSTTSLSFFGAASGSNPAPQSIAISNGVSGPLTGLSVTAPVAGNGQPATWVTAVLGSTAAPTSLTFAVNTAGLAVGTYTASVNLSAPNAQSSPRTIALNLTVSLNAAIALTPGSVARSVQVGSAPVVVPIAVNNGGGGSLTGLSLGATQYGTGQPAGWLLARLSGTQAPTQIDLTLGNTTLPLGTYTATLPVLSSLPGVPSVAMAITLTVVNSPLIVVAPTSLTFTSTGGANPVAGLVGITNGGGVALTGLSATVTYAAGQPAGWLVTSFAGGSTTAPASLVAQPIVLTLPVGVYAATVTLNAPNTPAVTVPVSLTVAGAIQLSTPAVVLLGTEGVGTFAPAFPTVTSAHSRPVIGLTSSVLTPGATWVLSSLSGTTTPATLQIGATGVATSTPRGPIAGSAVVRVSGTSVLPVDVTVSRQLMYTFNQHIVRPGAGIDYFSSPTNCSSCHSSQKPTQFSYAYLTSTFSAAQPALRYIDPGSTDPASSYLYVKLSTSGSTHKGRWTTAQEGVVSLWIADGARQAIP